MPSVLKQDILLNNVGTQKNLTQIVKILVKWKSDYGQGNKTI